MNFTGHITFGSDGSFSGELFFRANYEKPEPQLEPTCEEVHERELSRRQQSERYRLERPAQADHLGRRPKN